MPETELRALQQAVALALEVLRRSQVDSGYSQTEAICGCGSETCVGTVIQRALEILEAA